MTEVSFTEYCDSLRKQIGQDALAVKGLKEASGFKDEQAYPGQHSEVKANIMLAYRHLEDARMRIGKILQAAGEEPNTTEFVQKQA